MYRHHPVAMVQSMFDRAPQSAIETVRTVRTIFPETWIWQLVEVGLVNLSVMSKVNSIDIVLKKIFNLSMIILPHVQYL